MSIQSLSDIDSLFQKYRSLVQKESETLSESLVPKDRSHSANLSERQSLPFASHASSHALTNSDTPARSHSNFSAPKWLNGQWEPRAENEAPTAPSQEPPLSTHTTITLPIRVALESEFMISSNIRNTLQSLGYTPRLLRTEMLEREPMHFPLEKAEHIDYFKPMKPQSTRKRFEPSLLGMSISHYLMRGLPSASQQSQRSPSPEWDSLCTESRDLNTQHLLAGSSMNLCPTRHKQKSFGIQSKSRLRLDHPIVSLHSTQLQVLFSPLELTLPTSLSPQHVLDFFKKCTNPYYTPPILDSVTFSFTLVHSGYDHIQVPWTVSTSPHALQNASEADGLAEVIEDVEEGVPSGVTSALQVQSVQILRERPISPLYLSLCPTRFILNGPTLETPEFSPSDSLRGSQASITAAAIDDDILLNTEDFLKNTDILMGEGDALEPASGTSFKLSTIEGADPNKLDMPIRFPAHTTEDTFDDRSSFMPPVPNSSKQSHSKSMTTDTPTKSSPPLLPISSQPSPAGASTETNVKTRSNTNQGPSTYAQRRRAFMTQGSPTGSKQNFKSSSSSSYWGITDSLEQADGAMNYNTIVDNSEDDYIDKQQYTPEFIYEQVLAWPGHFELNPTSSLDFNLHDMNDQASILPSIQKVEWVLLSDPALPNSDTALDIVEMLENVGEYTKFVFLFWLAKSGNLDDAFVRLNLEDPSNYTTPMLFLSAQIRILSNRCEDALRDVEEILSRDRSILIVWSLKARLHFILGPPKAAINAYTHVIRARPKLWRYYYERGCELSNINELFYSFEDFKVVRQLNPDMLEPIWRHVHYYFEKQLYEDMQVTIQAILDKQPNNSRALSYRGKGYAQLQNFNKALEDFSNAIRLDPYTPEYYIHRGCLLRESHPQKAIEDLSVARLLDDSMETVDALLFRGFIYQKLGMCDLTLSDWLRARELISNPHLNTSLGILCIKYLDDYVQAMRFLDAAIDQDPTLLRAYLTRAELFQTMYHDSFVLSRVMHAKSRKQSQSESLLQRATKEYTRAIRMFPTNYLLYLYRGRLLLRQKKTKLAMHDFHSAFKLNSGIAQNFHQRALILSFQGRYMQFIDEFHNKQKEGERFDASVLVLVAKAKLRTRDYEGALETLADPNIRHKSEPQLFLHRGICLLALKRHREAIEELSKAIAVSPIFPKAYYMRGLCRFAEGGTSSGIADINMAIQQDPKQLEAYLTRAKYYQSIGAYDVGIEDCAMAIRLESVPIRGYLQRGLLRCCLLKFSSALKDFTKVLVLDQDCQKAYFNRGVAFHHLGKTHSAVRDYSIVMLMMDSEAIPRRNRGLLYLQMGDFENAVWDLKLSAPAHAVDIQVSEVIGKILFKLGKIENSISVLSQIVTTFPEKEIGYLARGSVYSQSGQYEKSIRDHLRCIHVNPRCLEAYVNLGYVFLKLGKYKRAWNLFTMALTLDPTCAAALEGRVSVHLGKRNYFAALMDISEAVRYKPQCAQLLLNRGVVYQCMGDSVSALQDYKSAIQLQPEYPTAYFNAANLYYLQRNWERAKEYYDIVLSFDPNDIQAIINRALVSIETAELLKAKELLITASKLAQFKGEKAKVSFHQAHLSEKMGNYREAEAYLDMVVKIMPHSKDGWVKRAEVRGHLGNIIGALEDFARAMAIESHRKP